MEGPAAAAAAAPRLRVAFLHWPQGDDRGFFLRLVREARPGTALEELPSARAGEAQVVFASLFADRAAFDAWRRAHPSPRVIFWFGENTRFPSRRHRAYDDYCLAQCDLVLGFKREHVGRANYARLPYWLVSREAYFDELGLPRAARFADAAALAAAAPRKTRFASLIARHDHTGLRGWMMRLLSHVGPVHCPSAAYRNVPEAEAVGEGWVAKRAYTATCTFSICPENSVGDGYTTEKPFDALLAGAWPVYHGERPCEPGILRQSCLLFADPEDVPGTVARVAQCAAAPPPRLPGALEDGGEQRIDALLCEAIAKVGVVVDAAAGVVAGLGASSAQQQLQTVGGPPKARGRPGGRG
jgi:alpha(1,3/1,4) fucosyltransferase